MKQKPIKLKVIPKPADGTRTVMIQEKGSLPFFKGPLDVPDMVCGSCGAVITTGVPRTGITQVVFQCACGAFNDTLDMTVN
jgi:hypothetical protein